MRDYYNIYIFNIDKSDVKSYADMWSLDYEEFKLQLQYFLHNLYCVQSTKGIVYVKLHHQILKSKYGHRKYNYVKRYLIKRGFIKEHSYYNPGLESKKYRLTDYALSNQVGFRKIKANRVLKKLIKHWGNFEDNEGDYVIKEIKSTTRKILKSARFRNEFYTVALYLALTTSKTAKGVEDKLKSYLITLKRLENGEIYTAYDGRRTYSNHTNIKSELLPFLLIGGKTTYEIDIKNSQFAHLAKLLKDKYNLSKDDEFYKHCMSGSIYDKFAEDTGYKREWAKQNLITALYISSKSQDKTRIVGDNEIYEGKIVDEWLSKNYSDAYLLIKRIKRKLGNKRFARLIQKLESNTVLNLQHKYLKYNVLTKHDSFISTDINVLNAIKKELTKRGFKTKDITNNQNECAKSIKEANKVINQLLNNKTNIFDNKELIKVNTLLSSADKTLVNEFINNIPKEKPKIEKMNKYLSIF